MFTPFWYESLTEWNAGLWRSGICSEISFEIKKQFAGENYIWTCLQQNDGLHDAPVLICGGLKHRVIAQKPYHNTYNNL